MRELSLWKSIMGLIVSWIIFASGNLPAFTLLEGVKNAINIPDAKDNHWQSKVLSYPENIGDSGRHWTAQDFFEQEFGTKLVFDSDKLPVCDGRMTVPYQVSNGWLEFRTGPKGGAFEFGAPQGDTMHPSIRFGAGWDQREADPVRLEIELEQSVDSSDWVFSIVSNNRLSALKKFPIKGKARQTYAVNLTGVTNIGNMANISMIKLECATAGASVKIRSIKIGPSGIDCSWRKEFDVGFEPVFAQVSFDVVPHYDLYVNGEKACSDSGMNTRGGIRTVDVKPFLRPGKNLIAFRSGSIGNYNDTNTSFLMEGIAMGKNGELARMLGDSSWRCSLTAEPGWEKMGFNDSGWKSPRAAEFSLSSQGRKTFNGLNPAHMGPLQTSPVGQRYPVFDYNSEKIEFDAKIPSGIQGRPMLEIIGQETGKVVGTVAPSAQKTEGDFTVFSFPIKLRDVGPYRLEWRLEDDGTITDQRTDEMIITGPIKQDEFGLSEFEPELEKRLELIRKIDCTKDVVEGREFLSHNNNNSGAHTTVPAPVVRKNGLPYRESGKNLFDWFGYTVELNDLGEAHMVEVIVPDDSERYVYSALVEVFPIPFMNNGTGRAWYNATGTCYTGGPFPLSHQMKKLRYIVFPSSKISTIIIKNGLVGKPAAASEINIYRIKGGLPALKLPPTKRAYGYHTERFTVSAQWCSENPLEQDNSLAKNLHVNAWYDWYKIFERKIKYMRYQGHNMAAEGYFMYGGGISSYASLEHNSACATEDFDPGYLLLKMYGHNKIKCLIGIEYMASPKIAAEGIDKLSDRKIHAGAGRGLYEIDRYGRQMVGTLKGGQNFLNPASSKYFRDTIEDIYSRYDGVGKPVGIFLVNGGWWMPGFLNPSFQLGLNDTDVGYSDDTVERFEKDMGILLGIPYQGGDRFAKRYELLMGKYRSEWLKWRTDILYRNFLEIEKIISSGKDKWTLVVHPRPALLQANPFSSQKSSIEERDLFWSKLLANMGMNAEKFGSDQPVKMALPLYLFKRAENNSRMISDGINNNRGTAALISKADYIYMGDEGLNEIGAPAQGAKEWFWNNAAVGVFVTRPVGDYAYSELVSATVKHTPKYIFNAWIDVNMDTGHGDQNRRFTKALFATPEAEFHELPDALGVAAQSALVTLSEHKYAYLRLVNPTPYMVSGTVENQGKALEDMVYDRILNSAGLHAIELRPFTVMILRARDANPGDFKCQFAFDQKTSDEIFMMATNLVAAPELASRIPAEYLGKMKDLVSKKDDAPALWRLLNHFEVFSVCRKFLGSKEMLVHQNMLEEQLKKEGRCRIDCGSSTDYTDLDGKVWLVDQAYTGFAAYGNEYASQIDRGNMEIEGTRAPGVYRTEAGGKRIYYYVPLRNGTYNVYIHIAETYLPNKESGRLFSVKINGETHQDINPLLKGKGFAKAGIEKWENVQVKDGMLSIEAWGGVGMNGIEIESVDKKSNQGAENK